MAGLLRGFEGRVGGKCVAIFDDFDRIWKVGQRRDSKAARREELGELKAFLAVVGADDEIELGSGRGH